MPAAPARSAADADQPSARLPRVRLRRAAAVRVRPPPLQTPNVTPGPGATPTKPKAATTPDAPGPRRPQPGGAASGGDPGPGPPGSSAGTRSRPARARRRGPPGAAEAGARQTHPVRTAPPPLAPRPAAAASRPRPPPRRANRRAVARAAAQVAAPKSGRWRAVRRAAAVTGAAAARPRRRATPGAAVRQQPRYRGRLRLRRTAGLQRRRGAGLRRGRGGSGQREQVAAVHRRRGRARPGLALRAGADQLRLRQRGKPALARRGAGQGRQLAARQRGQSANLHHQRGQIGTDFKNVTRVKAAKVQATKFAPNNSYITDAVLDARARRRSARRGRAAGWFTSRTELARHVRVRASFTASSLRHNYGQWFRTYLQNSARHREVFHAKNSLSLVLLTALTPARRWPGCPTQDQSAKTSSTAPTVAAPPCPLF